MSYCPECRQGRQGRQSFGVNVLGAPVVEIETPGFGVELNQGVGLHRPRAR